MQNDLIPFHFENQQIRIVARDGQPWFVAADVCAVLENGNSRQVVSRLDEDEKGVHLMDTLGGKQEMTVISESGLYSLVLRSDKPQAKPFRKWVTSEVLPTIRKTGRYETPVSNRKYTDELLNLLQLSIQPGQPLGQTLQTVQAKIFELLNIERGVSNPIPSPVTSPPMAPLSKRMGTREAAEYCGVSQHYLRMKRHRGLEPKCKKEWSRFVYLKQDLDEWLAKRNKWMIPS
ncbi:MAG: hypothetical protein H7833_00410 [Magnetococcus sp. DMHC-1]